MSRAVISLIAVFALAGAGTVLAETNEASKDRPTAEKPAEPGPAPLPRPTRVADGGEKSVRTVPAVPVYVPPLRGRPCGLWGGGSRGI